ncbi:hypothetical protein [Sphingomonas sp. KR3-1]|uniref:hypothetical protein n=1 Tax=Sphingomonas sp. KR3-1 TaxID=3156611 RepID=UPI0032B37053
MKRGLVAALALAGAAPATPGIDGFRGGHVRSPDGRWTVSAVAADPDRTMRTTAWLQGPGVQHRPLTRFERYLDVRWLRDIGKVMLVERTTHFARIALRTLGPRETGPRDRVQADIEQGLAGLSRLGTIENRRIAFGTLGRDTCVLAEESGLPPGRAEGSFIARRAAFRLDLAAGRAIRIRACPNATID